MWKIEDLHVHYGWGENQVRAVNGIDLELPSKGCVGLVGESGCGKSTLGKALLRLAPITSGDVFWDQEKTTHFKEKNFLKIRRQAQMVFQDPQASLNPKKNVRQVLAEIFKVHRSFSKTDYESEMAKLMEAVGLKAEDLRKYPHEFSGGQRQRIGIARALAVNPSYLICDEVVSALDVSVQAQILDLLRSLREDKGLGLLFITHDLGVVRHFCDELVVMYFGKVVEKGPTKEIFETPKNPYTKKLLNSIAGFGPATPFVEKGIENYHPKMWMQELATNWVENEGHGWLEI